ncbi:TPA: hypothetical protein ACH3X2_005445 [Trebouxia sp. C0005]
MANLMCTCIDRLQHQPHFSSATRLPILMSSYYAISRRVAASKAPRVCPQHLSSAGMVTQTARSAPAETCRQAETRGSQSLPATAS